MQIHKDDMQRTNSDRVWVVVEVQSGIPVLADVYADKAPAERREARLRRELRPDYDEVGVFEAAIKRTRR